MTSSLLIDLFQIVVLIYSVVLHELAHGLMARSMGDHTAEDMGRLTLNPFVHLDLFGSFILPIVSLLTTGVMFGYAKPVPYDPRNLSDHTWGPSKVALAGPLTNLVLAAAVGGLMHVAGAAMSRTLLELLGYVVWINVILAFFNLAPIPPLDGHWLLMAVLPSRFYGLKVALFRYQWILLILFLFVLFPLLFPVMAGLASLLTGVRLF